MKLTMWRGIIVFLNTQTKFGENGLLHLSFMVKWQDRRLTAKSGFDRPIVCERKRISCGDNRQPEIRLRSQANRPKTSTIFFAKIESSR